MPRQAALAALLAVIVTAAAAEPAGGTASGGPPPATDPIHYTIEAVLDPDACTISGVVEIGLVNDAHAALEEVALVLYPNRFAHEDPGINDLNRPYVYPRETFVAGGITVEHIEVARAETGTDSRPFGPLPASALRTEPIDGWADTLLHARLPAPLAPGERARLRAAFRTVLPERYGPFGIAEDRVTALAGWFPFLPALAPDGAWNAALPGRLARVDGQLRAPSAYTVMVGADACPAGHDGTCPIDLAPAPGPPGPALLASTDYRSDHRNAGSDSIALLELPTRRAFALPPRPPHAQELLDALERIVREHPAGMPPLERALIVAEAPLRLELTAPGPPGVVIVSDRILRVHRLLREFHERELATAVYAAWLRGMVAAREHAADAPWVTEGIAAELADRWLAAAHPRHRTVYDWIGLFNVFAIVDRFESAPKIPFARAFFPETRHADDLGDGVQSFARDRPPGRTIFTKLRSALGPPNFAAAIDGYLAGTASFRDTLAASAARSGRPLDRLLADWTAPYPEPLDYALGPVELNREDAGPAMDAGSAAGAPEPLYHHRLTITRASARPVREPVELELRGKDDERFRLTWEGDGDRATVEAETPWPARRAVLDPDRRLIEDTRADNARPPETQIVLDSADVTVTSSEFGVSGLFVGRQRYDYTKDVGLIAFLSDRSGGMHVGPRLHFGAPNDATSYRHNLFGFYTLAGLRGDFGDDSRPRIHTDGQLGGLGLRYDYTDEFAFDNPTSSAKVRLFADWYNAALGSSFDYGDWGVRASLVQPIVTPRTLVAVQVMNAFSAPTGGDRVPNQGRYSLGGDLAIRGIAVEERLGENIALARLELRQAIYPEVDHNFFDWVVFRHGQIRLFVDAGRVEDRRSSLYRVHDFAVGVGIGAAGFYDFMGFFPAVAYVAVAQRVDRFAGIDNGVQFLFGTRQAF